MNKYFLRLRTSIKTSNVNIISVSVLIIFLEKKAETLLNLKHLSPEHQKRQINCALLTFNLGNARKTLSALFDTVHVFGHISMPPQESGDC